MLDTLLLGLHADVEAALCSAERLYPGGILLDMHCFRPLKQGVVLQAPLRQAAAVCAKVLDLLAELQQPGQIRPHGPNAHCTCKPHVPN